ncbi:MAG: pyrroloquinoline quinone-dependent dehydrogenase, partial [Acidobacteria bacterium]
MMSHSSRRPAVLATLAVTAAVSAASYLIAQTRPPAGEWRHYSGDTDGAKYSALAQIDKDNVRNLRVAWRWQTPDRALQLSDPQRRAGRNEQTPLMVNGTLYTVSGLGLVAALDPGTGATQWVYDPESYHAGVPNNGGFLQRGFAYWADGSRERLLVGTADAYLLSVDARTGKPDLGFGTRGKADLTIGIRDAVRAVNYTARRPLVAGNVVVVGSSILDHVFKKEEPPGYVHGFDVRTGKLLWTFNTIPRPGELGYDTWLDNSAEYSGSTNVWAGGIYDPELDYIYLPSSTPTNNYYGGHRLGDNLFAESLICVQAKTGRRVWHFQAVHHGIWDYDFPAHPILGDITVNGRRIKAVIQVSKQGFTYVFDRKTGQPVWPIEERPVAASTVPGERTSPTQPFPTKPPAFETQGST